MGERTSIILLMAEFGGLQLLPETRKRIAVRAPGENKLFYWGLFVLLVSGGIYVGIYLYSQSLLEDLDNLDSDLIALEGRRDKANEERLQAFSAQSNLMSGALANHLFWTQALSKLQALVHSQVQLKSLNTSLVKKEIVFIAIAANQSVIARQVAAFNADEAVTDVSIGEIKSQPNGRLEFSVTVKFNDAKLLKKK